MKRRESLGSREHSLLKCRSICVPLTDRLFSCEPRFFFTNSSAPISMILQQCRPSCGGLPDRASSVAQTKCNFMSNSSVMSLSVLAPVFKSFFAVAMWGLHWTSRMASNNLRQFAITNEIMCVFQMRQLFGRLETTNLIANGREI